MKTILVTISRGSIAKNLLDTDFYEYLRSRFRLVVLTPAYQDERFLKQYAREGVQFLPLDEVGISRWERILFFFHKHLIYNSTVNMKSRWGIVGDPLSKPSAYPVYLFKYGMFSLLKRVRILRDIIRWIDARYFQKKEVAFFTSLLKEYDVSCVVATGMSDDNEVALIKAAQKVSIPSIGFPKSWDNLSKHSFRAKTDAMVVWNEFMKEQALGFQNYTEDKVVCVGVPQYDFNFRKEMFLSREDFCAVYGLDPKKKIILLGSEGKLFPTDTIVAEMIAHYVAKREGEGAQLLIRPHYGYKNDEKKFASLQGVLGVVIDLFNEPSNAFRDAWDYSYAFTERFVNAMRHADVVVNTASTLTLDAVCFDTPVISTAIDGYVQVPYRRSVERWYETHYYKKVLSYNATTLVRSKAELYKALDQYSAHPDYKSGERLKLRDDFVYRYDGGASMRFAKYVEYVTLQPNTP